MEVATHAKTVFDTVIAAAKKALSTALIDVDLTVPKVQAALGDVLL